jgi:hypothetical protein
MWLLFQLFVIFWVVYPWSNAVSHPEDPNNGYAFVLGGGLLRG